MGSSSGSADRAAPVPLLLSVSVFSSEKPASSPSTQKLAPKNAMASASESSRPPALTTMRTPASVFFGMTGLTGSTVAETPRSSSSISAILRSGAWAADGDGAMPPRSEARPRQRAKRLVTELRILAQPGTPGAAVVTVPEVSRLATIQGVRQPTDSVGPDRNDDAFVREDEWPMAMITARGAMGEGRPPRRLLLRLASKCDEVTLPFRSLSILPGRKRAPIHQYFCA